MREFINIVSENILTEAPLGDYQTFGNWDTSEHIPYASVEAGDIRLPPQKETGENSFISRFDRELVRMPKTETALRKYFSRFDKNVNLYFMNSRNGLQIAKNHLDYGKIGKRKISDATVNDLMLPELRKTLENTNPNDLTVVLTHNEGGSVRHILTPWLIVHRMAHALGADIINFGTAYESELQELCKLANTGHPYIFYFLRDHKNELFTFRAARENNFKDSWITELSCELFTQFVITGSVKLNVPNVIPENNRPKARKILNSIEKKLNNFFLKMIEKEKGVFVC